MAKRFYLFIVFFTLISCTTVFSQTISTSSLTGCAPLVGVNFTGVTGATNPLWNFGDGTTASIQNPTHTFGTKGIYVVTYTATGATAQSLTITVYGKPTPNFTALTATEGCIPFAVTFKDNSTSGGGTAITGWQWAFGDGGTNVTNSANQIYTYNIGGEFNVSLIVTDAHGCDSSLTIHDMVVVSQKPTISLVTNPNPAAACLPPLTVTFTSSGSTSHSPLGTSLTYSWNFGGGVTSTLATPPAQTYTASGTYPLSVTVTDSNHCSNTATKTVTIQNPTAVFTVADTVCVNDSTRFSPHGSIGGVKTWFYGDGQTGTDTAHYYTAPGYYHVVLKVTNGACFDTVGHNIYAEQPAPNFSATPTYICSLPAVVNITNTSSPPNSGFTYSWSYPFTPALSPPYASNISTATPQSHPTFTVTQTPFDTNRYIINRLDTSRIFITLTTVHGCVVHYSHVDTIFLPTARFMPNKYQGCVPLTVNFSDSSKFDNPKNPITSWKYIFGDGSSSPTINSAPGNTVHTYTAVGIYYPTLVIHTQDGCGDTSYAIKIEVGSPPVATFSVSPTTACIGDNVTLTNTTPTSFSVDTWHYYGDGGYYASSCSDAPNVTWPFTHATGPQNISLVACFRGCCDSVTQTGAVTVKGPLATFSVAMDCDSSLVYNFAGNISTIDPGTSWTWNFGDGDSTASFTPPASQNIAHTYTATGDYNVILSSYNTSTGCHPSKDTIAIHVRNIKANFQYDTLLCSKIPHSFDASVSNDVYTYGNNGYIWLWGDGTHPDITSGAVTSHSFSASGIDTVTLIVKDINSCTDTVRKVIKAFSVLPSFTCTPIMCINSTVSFTNTSVADTTVISYSWNFGDGTAAVITTSTTPNPPPHTYSISNTSINVVNVTLTLTSALGCMATYTAAINISRPNAIFHATSTINICSGSGVSFASTNSYPNMTWNYGDGNTLGPTPPTTTTSHSYTASGTYTISLTVTDAVGCTDIKTFNQNVSVQDYPVVSISSPDFGNNTLCYPHQSTYVDNTVLPAGVFQTRSWNLYNGSPTITSATVTPNAYNAPGTYSVTLTETTTFGCTASITKTIVLHGPVGNFTLTPSIICKDQSITFGIIDTIGVTSWNWDFGDGTIDSSSVSPITHTYTTHPPNGSTNVELILYGSTCSFPETQSISIRQVIAGFNRNGESSPTPASKQDTSHCIGGADLFTNISTGATSYGWNYGDGSAINSTVLSPQHTYTVPGTYTVELFIADNVAGCKDTVWKQMIIYPSFSVSATGDTICKGTPGHHLNATAAAVYAWNLSAGLSDTTIANPIATPSTTTTYTVYAHDINGCKDSATALVFVIQPPHDTAWSASIVIGQTIILPGGQASAGFTYTWTPVDNLSCTHCPTPVFNGTVDAHYVEIISDVRGCFKDSSTFDIEIKPLSSLDVPTAFTPNGDGTNDIVYVAGWGIKSLQYFKIFNRWGELVFECNDITVGWDGTYKGVPQNVETYVYEASGIPYISDKPITKKGYIKLLR